MEKPSAISMTGVERTFGKDEIIVSKTNLKGHITYANRLFMSLSGLDEKEILGSPHNIIRNPDMPRCIFKLLWDTIEQKKEIFAYVVNRSANGDHYWVLAHVTPTFDDQGAVNGYHSNRRVPRREVLNSTIIPLYQKLVEVEEAQPNRKEGMNNAYDALTQVLKQKGVSYDQFVFSL